MAKKTFKAQKSVNTFEISGKIVNQPSGEPFITNASGSFARFTIMQGRGRNKATGEWNPSLFIDSVVFKKDVGEIPTALLAKDTPVKASGYIRPDVYTNRDGNRISKLQFVIRKIEEDVLVDIEYDDGEGEDGESVPEQGENRA